MKVYTKSGDKGITSLLGGTRVSKAHMRIEAYGTVDELNAHIGMLRDQQVNTSKDPFLNEIQERLFTIGAELATAPDKKNIKKPDILDQDVSILEEEIDRIEHILPVLKHFILPGGHIVVSHCHLARTVCRRAERRVIALNELEPVSEIIIKYLNRLSDYLFVLGRLISKELEVKEITWEPRVQ